MKLSKRSSYVIDEETIDDLINSEYNQKPSKRITDLICSLLNYFSLIPTLIYNIAWFFAFKRVLENMGGDLLPIDLDKDIQGCTEMYDWANFCITWITISFFKAVFLLTIVRSCCGAENDCNICCLLIKCVSSLIPSIIFVIRIPDIVNNYKAFNVNMNMNLKMKDMCDELSNSIYLYYNWEYAYILFIMFIFCFIPTGVILMCLKELWKSRAYSKVY
jgi:hypothetical protein